MLVNFYFLQKNSIFTKTISKSVVKGLVGYKLFQRLRRERNHVWLTNRKTISNNKKRTKKVLQI